MESGDNRPMEYHVVDGSRCIFCELIFDEAEAAMFLYYEPL